jgi:hypothetical protein
MQGKDWLGAKLDTPVIKRVYCGNKHTLAGEVKCHVQGTHAHELSCALRVSNNLACSRLRRQHMVVGLQRIRALGIE